MLLNASSLASPHVKLFGSSFVLMSGVSVPTYFWSPQMNFFIHWMVPRNFLTALADLGVGHDWIWSIFSLLERMPLAEMKWPRNLTLVWKSLVFFGLQ